MTHEELDDLFRANAERGDFAPNPGEWAEMTRLLEEDERRERYGRWVSAAWALLFVGLIGFGIRGAIAYAPDASQTIEDRRAATAAVSAPRAQRGPRPAAPLKHAARVDGRAAAPKTSLAIPRGAPTADRLSQSPMSARPAAVPLLPSGRLVSAPVSNDLVGSGRRPAAEAASRRSERRRSDAPEPARSNESLTPLASRPTSALFKAPTNLPALYDTDGGRRLTDRVVCCSLPARLTVGPLVAAEATRVSVGADLTFGYRAGLRAAYRVSQRLRLNAAVAVGRRNYHAGLGDTDMPAELFAGHVRPHSTVSSATVVEFPIGIEYTPESAVPAAWFLSAAVNSYRYLSEEMAFEYPEHRPGQFSRMRDPRPGGTLAASLRLGGGVWLRPGGRPALRVSPYVELPLRAQAYSEVSLYSVGVQVSTPLLRR